MSTAVVGHCFGCRGSLDAVRELRLEAFDLAVTRLQLDAARAATAPALVDERPESFQQAIGLPLAASGGSEPDHAASGRPDARLGSSRPFVPRHVLGVAPGTPSLAVTTISGIPANARDTGQAALASFA